MKLLTFQFNGFQNTPLPGILWLPDQDPVCILQIAHGLTEHIGRFDELARKLTACGIAVAGFDLRGHGENLNGKTCISMGTDGWMASLQDMHIFFKMLQNRFQGLPHYMLGFSLGSFLLRDYLGFYSDAIDGAAILGTGEHSQWLLSLSIMLANSQIRKCGFDHTTPLVCKLSSDVYNRYFKPLRTQFDWICSDPVQLSAYISDPHVCHRVSSGLSRQLLESMKRCGTVASYQNWNPSMPVLLMSGMDDAVGNCGKGIHRLLATMKAAGLKQVSMHLIPNARHDLFHEEASGASAAAFQILLDFLKPKQ